MLGTTRRRIAVFTGLCFLLLVSLTGQLRAPDGRAAGALGAWTLTALGPAQTALDGIAGRVAGAWRLLAEIGDLRRENARLRAEVERLSEENARLHDRAARAPRLEALLGMRAAAPGRAIAARVVARTPEQWFASIVLDRGAADGVARNASVVAAGGLVGRVVEIAPHWSRVLLVTDPRSAVAIRLQRSREVGIVEGRGEPLLGLKYVAREARLEAGDRLVTSGYGGVFPPGLVVGLVAQVRAAPGGVFQEATVAPAAELSRLEEVLILTGGVGE